VVFRERGNVEGVRFKDQNKYGAEKGKHFASLGRLSRFESIIVALAAPKSCF
jgi:hypothetical protein